MADLFGSSRTVVKGRYALLTSDGFVPGKVPGWQHAQTVVNISPALGARFVQMQVNLGRVGVGDVIWTAPYCPQWFVAMGKTPASYIYYQDVNRDSMPG